MNKKTPKHSNQKTTPAFDLNGLISQKLLKFRKLKSRAFPLKKFEGSGIYALYYEGDNKVYQSQKNSRGAHPIYIGRTNSSLTIKNGNKKRAYTNLYQKIKEQVKSIEEVKNLNLEDFKCKCMVLNDQYQALSESLEAELINKHRPEWNICVEGFANHNPGKSRNKQAPSEWDTLHPGRNWVKSLKGSPKSRKLIERKIKHYVKSA